MPEIDISKVKRPERKPSPTKIVPTAEAPGRKLANAEYMAAIGSMNPLAQLGADPDRVVQLPYTSNFAGSFAGEGELSLESDFTQEAIATLRPELAEEGGDIVALRAPGSPDRDKGITVTHEFGHRALQKMRDANEWPASPKDTLYVVKSPTGRRYRIKEEGLLWIIDSYRGDRENTIGWFQDEYKISRYEAERIMNDDGLKLFIAKLMAKAAAEVRRQSAIFEEDETNE